MDSKKTHSRKTDISQTGCYEEVPLQTFSNDNSEVKYHVHQGEEQALQESVIHPVSSVRKDDGIMYEVSYRPPSPSSSPIQSDNAKDIPKYHKQRFFSFSTNEPVTVNNEWKPVKNLNGQSNACLLLQNSVTQVPFPNNLSPAEPPLLQSNETKSDHTEIINGAEKGLVKFSESLLQSGKISQEIQHFILQTLTEVRDYVKENGTLPEWAPKPTYSDGSIDLNHFIPEDVTDQYILSVFSAHSIDEIESVRKHYENRNRKIFHSQENELKDENEITHESSHTLENLNEFKNENELVHKSFHFLENGLESEIEMAHEYSHAFENGLQKENEIAYKSSHTLRNGLKNKNKLARKSSQNPENGLKNANEIALNSSHITENGLKDGNRGDHESFHILENEMKYENEIAHKSSPTIKNGLKYEDQSAHESFHTLENGLNNENESIHESSHTLENEFQNENDIALEFFHILESGLKNENEIADKSSHILENGLKNKNGLDRNSFQTLENGLKNENEIAHKSSHTVENGLKTKKGLAHNSFHSLENGLKTEITITHKSSHALENGLKYENKIGHETSGYTVANKPVQQFNNCRKSDGHDAYHTPESKTVEVKDLPGNRPELCLSSASEKEQNNASNSTKDTHGSSQLDHTVSDFFPEINDGGYDSYLLTKKYLEKTGGLPRADGWLPMVIFCKCCNDESVPQTFHPSNLEPQVSKQQLFEDAVKEGKWKRRYRQQAFPGAQIKTWEEDISSGSEGSSSSDGEHEKFKTNPYAPRILLMGLPGSGKSSIRKVIFDQVTPENTVNLRSTDTVVKCDISNTSSLQLQAWDMPWSNRLFDGSYESFLTFRVSEAIIFVIDAQIEYKKSLLSLQYLIKKVHKIRSTLQYDIFIHKVDAVLDKKQVEVLTEIQNKMVYWLRETGMNKVEISFHLTSIYDYSIIEAFSKVVQKVIPQPSALENILQSFVAESNVTKAFLMHPVNKIYFATDSLPVDMQSYESCCTLINQRRKRFGKREKDTAEKQSPFSARVDANTVLHMKEINQHLALLCASSNAGKEGGDLEQNFNSLCDAIQGVFEPNKHLHKNLEQPESNSKIVC